ncbi:High-affinity branched-chain amino acid transport system permease protein LivH [Fundidesulfovibrio magnetotacticus]|uniref:High-affinity branched-chain amino acid transport system permease protein LivH n=1 Tax=Fundidesulfovibrio magnetotacticus TaxID=2730080 RepID=A0A6V8M4B7_9BACT|nr:branched-chain amino acid ABC transporter permease [Fundidesulfovibrio magnetotacticus]GFK95255.1 High-affinity branched-chain amino acid transport system permease protein LivH [Fundidesulfovibrio magnetotacticus]
MLGLYLAQAVNSGLALGAVYGLMALGFALVYNSSRLINFAQGELLLLGGLVLFSVSQAFQLGPLTALLAAGAFGFALGHLLYASTLGVLLGAQPLRQLMLTVAASLIWQGAAILIWGKNPLKLDQFIALPAFRMGPLFLSANTLTSLALALASVATLSAFLTFTRTGRAIRAVSMNALAARLQGVNPVRAQALSFALSGMLAALAAMAIGPQTMLRYDMGFGLGLKGFVAATLGGYSSLSRVFAGGLALGVIEACLTLSFSADLKETLTYSLLVALLVFSPLERGRREKV